MRIHFHKNFRKGVGKLTSSQKRRVGEVLELFEQDPHHPLLRNHPLHGGLKGKRAIVAGGDLRLIFLEENDYEVVHFLRIGSHDQVY